jgi:hypothetical protein
VLEALDRRLVELLLPVEGRRAVVGEHLAWEVLVHRFCEDARLLKVRMRGLPPEEIGVAGISKAAGDAVVESGALLEAKEALRRAGVGLDEGPVALVHVGGDEAG